MRLAKVLEFSSVAVSSLEKSFQRLLVGSSSHEYVVCWFFPAGLAVDYVRVGEEELNELRVDSRHVAIFINSCFSVVVLQVDSTIFRRDQIAKDLFRKSQVKMMRPDKDSRDLKVVSELLKRSIEVRFFRELSETSQDLSLEALDGILYSLLFISEFFTSLWVKLIFVERCGPLESESSCMWVDAKELKERDVLLVAVLFSKLTTSLLIWTSS